MPEFAHLGPIFKSSLPVDLTESEVEYVVRCIKHVFSHYIAFQVTTVLLRLVLSFTDVVPRVVRYQQHGERSTSGKGHRADGWIGGRLRDRSLHAVSSDQMQRHGHDVHTRETAR